MGISQGLDANLHEIAIVGHLILGEPVLKIFLGQLTPAVMIPKQGEQVAEYRFLFLFFLGHGGKNGIVLVF